ncbi:Cubilinlike, partial [Caligus rogercresseyi]
SPSHPNAYPHNKICDFLIAQPVGFNIHVEFIEFDIEDSYLCYYDYLEIRDGDNSNSTSIGHFAATHLAFLHQLTPPTTIFGSASQQTTPKRANPKDIEHYPHNMDCKWIIKGHPGSIIRLEWTEFILEEEYECSYDYIQVTDRAQTHSDHDTAGQRIHPS